LDVIVVGAGAAGLMAALTAAERGARVRLLDSQEKIGAKILVAGGGRCNVTNVAMDVSQFETGAPRIVERVLRAFSLEDTLRFFEAVGVPLKLEPEMGKYFPVSNRARDVLDALVETVAASGAELRTGQRMTEVTPGPPWTVRTEAGAMAAGAVVICTGGLALPKSGSDGAGYTFASRLGHSVVRTCPALTPLLAEPAVHAGLSGVTLPARLQLRDGGRTLADFTGSFLFTHTGYSGPAALNISRHVERWRWECPEAGVYARFLPEVETGGEGRFWDELVRRSARKTLGNALAEVLPRRVAEMAAGVAGVPLYAPVGRLTARDRGAVMDALLDQRLPVAGVAGYRKAEATAGGISLDEVEPATMMSRLAPGLFFAGEALDVDGHLGGYNFQWAWSSGTVAGRAAARWKPEDG
jgi:predicted Rossmann fold flavoprotein